MFRQIQRCESTEPYFIQDIPSRSQGGLIYEVHSILPDDPMDEYTCSCPGFRFNGRCAHQVMAYNDRCRWDETQGPEQQTEEQKLNQRCPRCGQNTIKETIDDD